MSEQYVVTNPSNPVPASIYQDVVILGVDGQPLRDEQNRIKVRRHVTYGYESLPLSGGTMKGSLILKGNPSSNLEAAPKQYVDTAKAKSDSTVKLATKRKIDGVEFDGTADIVHYGTCSTAAATAAKTVACSNWKLVTGAFITVLFTVTNTASNPTLNVNNTGAKRIQYRNATINPEYLAANRVYIFVYDGSAYELIGDINTDTDTKVAEIVTTTNDDYPLVFTGTNDLTANKTEGVRFCKDIKVNPSTKTITANTFKGALSGNATSSSKWATKRTITFSGGATGSGTIDGSGNVTIPLTLAEGSLPTGTMVSWPGKEIPEGFLWCNGATFDKEEYPALYDFLGTNVLPDLRDRTIWGATSANDVGKYLEDGLPNVQGSFTCWGSESMYQPSGAFRRSDPTWSSGWEIKTPYTNGWQAITFSSQRDNAIYGNSAKVQTRGYQALMIIKS